ncbi:hypothetical protein CTAM01_17165 [Colletotrichum tamarilloi]|uniref:Rhodopsin domain-containing protein n=1 Tax=Colletotrichum tamarilloi TaxID=1209934 RepID=A0ABQ9QGK3_9PEZI|nr:uncharacterized protein CTAM01_17165 [Colletotrichum tamarilloi]KAK1458631.1 hypothetical protein CTAM01_17165 [Colletotrichum tamarilloi]
MSEPSFTSANTVAPAATGNLVYLHYVVFGVGYGVSTLLVLLRLYHRNHNRNLKLSDMLATFSWVFSSVMQILMIGKYTPLVTGRRKSANKADVVAISMGTMCFPRASIPDDRYRIYVEVRTMACSDETIMVDQQSQLSYNAAPAFMLTIGFAKVSMLCFYLETFSPNAWLNKAARITQGVVITTTVAITLLLYLSRLPSLSLDAVALFLATAASNIIMDVVLLILPMPALFNLQMALNTKLSIAGIFGLGLLTTVTSILRLYLLIQIQGSEDLTWDAAPANITSYVSRKYNLQYSLTDERFLEVNLLLICTCVPAVRQFFKNLKRDSYTGNQPNFTNRASGTRQLRLDSSSQVRLRELTAVVDTELGMIVPRSRGADSDWSEPKDGKNILNESTYI